MFNHPNPNARVTKSFSNLIHSLPKLNDNVDFYSGKQWHEKRSTPAAFDDSD